MRGDEERIAAFRHLLEKNKPELAEVSRVTFEDPDGEVGRTSEVAMFCFFDRLYQAIPLLLDMRDDLKEMKNYLKEMKGDLKIVQKNTDVIPRSTKISKASEKTFSPGYATNFRQVQADADVTAIRSLGNVLRFRIA